MEDFEKFLFIDEPLPEYRTPTGRIKKRKSVIGRKTSAHDSMNGILDVAMISSLGREDKINEIVKQYGMVIMDECHHAAAQIAQEVLNEVNAKYVYGLTATPKRDDGQEQKIFLCSLDQFVINIPQRIGRRNRELNILFIQDSRA